MKHIMNPSSPRASVRERHKPRAPHPVIIVVLSPDPDSEAERCTRLDPLTPIWTQSQSLGNDATWQSVHKTLDQHTIAFES